MNVAVWGMFMLAFILIAPLHVMQKDTRIIATGHLVHVSVNDIQDANSLKNYINCLRWYIPVFRIYEGD